jgi:hypothetical protein
VKKNALKLLSSLGFIAAVSAIGAAIHAVKKHRDSQGFEVVRIEKGHSTDSLERTRDRVVLKNGMILDSIGYDLKYIGEMSVAKHALIFSGRDCIDCGSGLDFFVYSVNDSHMTYFPYPAARAYTYGEKDPFYEGRAFFGNCLGRSDGSAGAALSERSQGIIAFGSSREDDGSWKKLVMTFSLDETGELEETTIAGNLPDIENTLKEVSQGRCHEFPHEEYSEE